MKKDLNVITTLSLVGITILSGIILASNKVSADDSAIDNVNVTVPISCTMSSVISSGEEHTATLNPGTYSGASGSDYENGIGKTTLTTFCNDDNGFSIYAVGFTGDTMEGENHTKLVGTSASNNATIPTKVYESSDTTSNWSMKVTKVDDSTKSYNPQNMTITNNFNNWHVVPDTYIKVAEYKATTGTSTTDTTLGAKVETTYAVYVSTSQAADTYTGKVKYTMVHPYNNIPADGPQSSTPGCITYHRGANDVVGTMGCQLAMDDYSIDLLASNFSRTGYGFAGWSDSYDYATNVDAKFYGPQETITVPTGTTANGLSLYAVWIKSQGSIQDQSKVASVCSSLTTAPTDGTANLTSVSALTDQRDNNTYAIAKLADGNCWMIENLRLENTALHNTDGSLAQGYNTSFIGLAAPEIVNFDGSTTANSLYSINEAIQVIPRYNNINTMSRANDVTWSYVNIYSYGNYYNWNAAIADTIQYSYYGDHGTTSICPTGWRIPHAFEGFRKLDIDMGGSGSGIVAVENSNRWRKYPVNFLYSGLFSGSEVSSRGSEGLYWSSTADSEYGNDISYRLDLSRSSVLPGTSSVYRSGGYSIRCMVVGSY